MPSHKAAAKSLKQDARRNAHNRSTKSRIRTVIKKVRVAVSENNIEVAKTELRMAVSALDTAAKTHLIHSRNASRRKSRLMQLVSKAEAALKAEAVAETEA